MNNPRSVTACPSNERLAQFLLDDETTVNEEQIESHIALCQTCQGRLEQLTVADDLELKAREEQLPKYLASLISRPPDHLSTTETDQSILLPELPGFLLHERLGHGGMGVVYRATQTSLNREVAVKVIAAGVHSGSTCRERLHREGRLVAKLKHPNFVRVFDFGEHQGLPYLVLELIKGGNVDSRKSDLNNPQNAASLISVLASALETAHRQGIVHRDLKPANILLAPVQVGTPSDKSTIINFSGEQFVPKIADFGLSKDILANSGQSLSGALLGTPGYMSPEQATENPGSIGPRSDLYALGVILYELICRRRPFEGTSTLEVLDQVRDQPPIAPRLIDSSIPEQLEAICLKCLAKNPHDRFETAALLADDLNAFIAGHELQHTRPISRWSLARAFAGFGILAASVVIIWTYAETIVDRRIGTSDKTTVNQQSNAFKDSRTTAEWIIRNVGSVSINGQLELISNVAQLPGSDFTLTRILTREGGGLRDADLEMLGALPTIQAIGLDTQDLKGEQLSELNSLPDLQQFVLYDCPVTDANFERFTNYENLDKLGVASTRVSNRVINRLTDAPKLRHLILSDSQVDTELTKMVFPRLKTVELFDLYEGTDRGLATLKDLPSLQTLNVFQSELVTDEGIQSIVECRHVRRLTFHATDLTSVDLMALTEMSDLDRLEFQGCGVKPKLVRELANRLTACDVLQSGERNVAKWVEEAGGTTVIRVLGKRPTLRRMQYRDIEIDSIELPPESRVTDDDLKRLNEIEHLNELSVTGSSITGRSLEHVSHLTTLKSVVLRGSSVDDFSMQWLAQLPVLTVLDVTDTKVTILGLIRFVEHPELRRLSVSRRQLVAKNVSDVLKRIQHLEDLAVTNANDAVLKSIIGLPLTRLTLEQSFGVTDSSLEVLASLKRLEQLTINQTSITPSSIPILQTMDSLEHIKLPASFTADDIARIRKSLNNCCVQ